MSLYFKNLFFPLFALSVLLKLFSPMPLGATTLTVPPARSNYDISYDYHIKLLTRALQLSAPYTNFEFSNSLAMSQGRAEAELIKGDKIDVYWFGTNKQIESKLRAIRIPTTRGLIGYRKFIINKALEHTFDQIKSIDDLKQFVACQGAHWPDTKILGESGLPVTTSTSYENLFLMTSLNRCDYFPRGYHDAINELQLRGNKYPSLISYDRILLHYPFAVYFFTNKSDINLADQIESGLQMMAEKGEILELMKSHPLTKSIFPIKSELNSLYLSVENPFIELQNFNDKKYWFTPKDFKINR